MLPPATPHCAAHSPALSKDAPAEPQRFHQSIAEPDLDLDLDPDFDSDHRSAPARDPAKSPAADRPSKASAPAAPSRSVRSSESWQHRSAPPPSIPYKTRAYPPPQPLAFDPQMQKHRQVQQPSPETGE